MGILNTLRDMCFGPADAAGAPTITRRTRRCQIEELEPRRLFAVDVAPHVMLGSVYFEEATGDDSAPDILQVSFVGGAAGTTLNRLTINGDKTPAGIGAGDVFFDTAAGGLGAFEYDGLKIVSANGFTVNSVTVVDGGSQIVFDLSGFDAGEKLVFSVDADEVQYVEPTANDDGQITPDEIDTNSLVEGAEFQRSTIVGEFSAIGFVDLTLPATYWDAFDPKFAQAHNETGLSLDLPDDAYSLSHDFIDRTAGAVAHDAQIPLASISGWVFHDKDDNGVFAHGVEPGIGGVTVELLDANGNPTGITTTTSNEPGKVGFYEFRNLVPGKYGVREVQPTGWLDGKDAAGDHGGTAASEVAGRVDRITGAMLNYGDHAQEYNFGELLPGTISGRVHADDGPDCDFDHPEHLLEGVKIELLNSDGNVIATTFTNQAGEYEFTGLVPGTYSVREYLPVGLYDGGERVGTLGGESSDVGSVSYISGIEVGSDEHGTQYDFCEKTPSSISGRVHADTHEDCDFDDPDILLEGVRIDLLDANGNLIATTLTNAQGEYYFGGLDSGIYQVREHQPTEYYDGGERVGSVGGVAGDIGQTFSMFTGIALPHGTDAIQYDFCEKVGVTLSGNVYHDRDDDGNFDRPGEEGIGNVLLKLLDGNGADTGLRATTDSAGHYEFTNLRAGTYTVIEVQPVGWLDGKDTPGNRGGVADVSPPGDRISQITLGWGLSGIEYNFGELLPGSIAGRVHADDGPDCDFDHPEHLLEGVQIDLLDGSGHVIATTYTNQDGEYEFNDLPPGTYTVNEHLPEGYFDGGERVGTLGGASSDIGAISIITGINVGSDQHGVQYDFCEKTPSSISGRVHADDGPDCDFDDPHVLLEGVQIDLLDGDGNFIRSTFTNADGEYYFGGLPAGQYQIREHQPTEYYDGGERVGSEGGQSFDLLPEYSMFSDIDLGWGTDGIQYDFCEKPGVMLSGNVYHDKSDDGIFDRDTEEGIGGVLLKLLDENGNDTGLRATTNAQGFYKFNNLAAGKYTVIEVQPAGWLDGKDTPGNLGGIADVSPPGDRLSQIMINWGEMGTEYNFGELLPGKISGRIHADEGPDCDFDHPEHMLEGVQVDLLDSDGAVIATTHTNADGYYEFAGLRPGTYGVREHQPTEYFDGGERVGSEGGISFDQGNFSLFTGIDLGSGISAIQYDFCEKPGAELSGYVFIDGAPIFTIGPITAEQIAAQRNGLRSNDDTPLAGVTLELRQAQTGAPILIGDALPGSYSGAATDPIRVVTDENGYYHFVGLRQGFYAIVEVQPEDVIDNVDTPGTLGGFAVNPEALLPENIPQGQADVIELFRADVGNDAVVSIPLLWGQHSQENNFSEVTLTDEPPIIPPPRIPPKPPVFGPAVLPPTTPLLLLPPVVKANPFIFNNSRVLGYTWHLSVVNAGMPRSLTAEEMKFQLTSSTIDVTGWQNVPMNQAKWTLATLVDGSKINVLREDTFGNSQSIPVTGDFNGDGVTDIAVFIDGQWFIDLNGNGKWDEGDMWAKLGAEDDMPVAGDWDDDGKADIGIYGPAWSRDPWAISREPGLPDADNFPTKPGQMMKNMPPTAEDATSGGRILKRTARGKNRADVIDHVFHYGQPTDLPVAGDWNGDGIRQIGVFIDGQWTLDSDGDGRLTDADAKFSFGEAGDKPVVGDFNGDGVDEVGVYRAGLWIVDSNADHVMDAQDKVFELGGANDKPVVGDWNDDGTDDPGVFSPGQGVDHTARRAG